MAGESKGPLATIDAIVKAISEELAEQQSKTRKPIELTSGSRLHVFPKAFVYQFILNGKPANLEVGPTEIVVGGSTYECDVFALTEESVNVVLPANCGERIAKAHLHRNREEFLTLLKNQFERSRDNDISICAFVMSEKVLAGTSNVLNADITKLKGSLCEGLNKSQREAVKHSLNQSLSILWGPPGTGKTNTIAKIVEAHLNAGRRVLLVSSANAAVDGALKKIAEQLKDKQYERGELLRWGTAQDADLVSEFPLVLRDNIVESRIAPLRAELVLIGKETDKLTAESNSVKEILAVYSQIEEMRQSVAANTGELDRLRTQFRMVSQQRETTILDSEHQQLDEKEKEITQSSDEKYLFEKDVHAKIDQMQQYVSKQAPKQDLERSAQHIREQLKPLDEEKEKLNNEIGRIRDEVVNAAKVVATTITQTFMQGLSKQMFDVLIVDEISMVSMAHLYWAASKARLAVTVVGDFNQLPPIANGKSDLCRKWLKNSIFHRLYITTPKRAQSSPSVVFLDTQYRMVPAIASISNELFYDNMLIDAPSTNDLSIGTGLDNHSAITLIDTTDLEPTVYVPKEDSRANFLHAQTTARLALGLLRDYQGESIGIITPYRAQANLIKRLLGEAAANIAVNTIHSFQGAEYSIVIFDTVESEGRKENYSLIYEKNNDSAGALLNVGLTRARKRFYLVANCKHLLKTIGNNSYAGRIIERIKEKGTHVPAVQLFRLAQDVSLDEFDSATDILFDQDTFWAQFEQDAREAKEKLVIVCPFFASYRCRKLIPLFKELIERNIQITVVCRPPEKGNRKTSLSAEALDGLVNIGVRAIQIADMHQKIVIIDNSIVYNGSLNVLSCSDSYEVMQRIVEKSLIREFAAYVKQLIPKGPPEAAA